MSPYFFIFDDPQSIHTSFDCDYPRPGPPRSVFNEWHACVKPHIICMTDKLWVCIYIIQRCTYYKPVVQEWNPGVLPPTCQWVLLCLNSAGATPKNARIIKDEIKVLFFLKQFNINDVGKHLKVKFQKTSILCCDSLSGKREPESDCKDFLSSGWGIPSQADFLQQSCQFFLPEQMFRFLILSSEL